MSPAQVGQRVCDAFDEFAAHQPSNAKWDELRNRLLLWFGALDEQLAFDGMVWVLEHSLRYQHQQLAGELLARRGVPLPTSPSEFIRRVAPMLNASANEVMKYLRSQAGDDVAQQAVRSLIADTKDERMRSGLRSLAYGLGMKEAFDDVA